VRVEWSNRWNRWESQDDYDHAEHWWRCILTSIWTYVDVEGGEESLCRNITERPVKNDPVHAANKEPIMDISDTTPSETR
jgi:hypothetical protein